MIFCTNPVYCLATVLFQMHLMSNLHLLLGSLIKILMLNFWQESLKKIYHWVSEEKKHVRFGTWDAKEVSFAFNLIKLCVLLEQ